MSKLGDAFRDAEQARASRENYRREQSQVLGAMADEIAQVVREVIGSDRRARHLKIRIDLQPTGLPGGGPLSAPSACIWIDDPRGIWSKNFVAYAFAIDKFEFPLTESVRDEIATEVAREIANHLRRQGVT